MYTAAPTRNLETGSEESQARQKFDGTRVDFHPSLAPSFPLARSILTIRKWLLEREKVKIQRSQEGERRKTRKPSFSIGLLQSEREDEEKKGGGGGREGGVNGRTRG